jgi:AcrR family transcriptional regulator
VADDVARVVALAWGAAEVPQRGPKRELSLERIVEVAIEIADAEGLGAVTMQRVAQAFGYTTMAMYRYVPSKDDLHVLMLDAVARDVVAVDDEDWRAGLEQWSRWLLDVYRAHPWGLDIPLSMEALLMPEQMRVADAALRAMRSLPATPEQRLLLLTSLSAFVRGHVSVMREVLDAESALGDGTRAIVREAATTGRFPDLAPLVESGAYLGELPDGMPAPEDPAHEELALGLAIWLEGVAATFERGDGHAEPTAAPADPAEALERAEAELRAATALRKQTQLRVRELERREQALRKARDAAKEAAKAAERASRLA